MSHPRIRRAGHVALSGAAPDQRGIKRLASRSPAELLVPDGDYMHALRGSVSTVGNAIALHVTDDLRLTQRRWWSRVEVPLEARLLDASAPASPVETTTINVSPGGLLVHWPAEQAIGTR